MFKLLFTKYKKLTLITAVMAGAAIGLGFLSHFAFDFSGKNYFVGLFVPVNESIWEHLKLLFFPFIITMFFEYFIYGKRVYSFFSSKFLGLIIGIISIITNYYTAIGAFGIDSMALNIGIFILSVIIAYAVSYMRILRNPKAAGGLWETTAIFLMGILFTLFMTFTYYPPHIPLFLDPNSMRYSAKI